MEDSFQVIENYLMVRMPEEIDHHKSVYISKKADDYIMQSGVGNVVFDFEDTKFMDSSGIGLIMGRYRALGMGQKCIAAVNVDRYMDKLLHLSGVHRYMEIQKKIEEGGHYGKDE